MFGVTVVGRVGTWSGPVVRDVFEAHVVRRVRGEGVGGVRGSRCGLGVTIARGSTPSSAPNTKLLPLPG